MAILDLQDLRAIIDEMGKRATELRSRYGNIAPATVGVLQRRLLVLEQQGAANFFGEPALDIIDFLRRAPDGRGVINILAAEKLMTTPRLYATFLLWMLSELFEQLPEVGDLDKPKLVFLFDEAHLLFNGASQAVLDQIERVTRLIRSKGVGVYYVTQSPGDVPDRVSAQLGNRVQHALRAFTPKEQKAVRAAAQTFRPNPEFNTERVIQELQVGEALVSVLFGNGEPSVVQRTLIRPPMSRVGPLTPAERRGADRGRCRASDKIQGYDPRRVGPRAASGAQHSRGPGQGQAPPVRKPVRAQSLIADSARASVLKRSQLLRAVKRPGPSTCSTRHPSWLSFPVFASASRSASCPASSSTSHKTGVSTSLGGRGATVNVGTRSRTATFGIPGTGLSYRMPLGGSVVVVIAILALALAVLWLFQPELVLWILHKWQPKLF